MLFFKDLHSVPLESRWLECLCWPKNQHWPWVQQEFCVHFEIMKDPCRMMKWTVLCFAAFWNFCSLRGDNLSVRRIRKMTEIESKNKNLHPFLVQKKNFVLLCQNVIQIKDRSVNSGVVNVFLFCVWCAACKAPMLSSTRRRDGRQSSTGCSIHSCPCRDNFIKLHGCSSFLLMPRSFFSKAMAAFISGCCDCLNLSMDSAQSMWDTFYCFVRKFW